MNVASCGGQSSGPAPRPRHTAFDPAAAPDDPRAEAAAPAAVPASQAGPQQRDVAVHNCGKIYIESRIKTGNLTSTPKCKSFPVTNILSS